MVMMVMMGTVVARVCPDRQRTLQVSGHRLVGVGFRGHQRGDALGGETVAQARPHAAGDQHLHGVQRMRLMRRTLVKGLFDGQFQQGLPHDLALFDVVNPELAALAGMFGHGAAILTGDGDFHIYSYLKSIS